MKTKSRPALRRFPLKLLAYGTNYYIERIGELETALARRPRRFQIEMVGDGEIPADLALLIRSILVKRPEGIHVITHARSSLRGGAVLVWLQGDTRIIREDARLFFRKADVSEDEDEGEESDEPKYSDSYTAVDPDEADYAAVLERINEFLPMEELLGRQITVPMLRQFGLVANEKFDHFLTTAFGGPVTSAEEPPEIDKVVLPHPITINWRSGEIRN